MADKKKAKHKSTPMVPAVPADKTLSRQDHLQLLRHEHAAALAKLNLELAQAHERVARAEITQAAQAATQGTQRAQAALRCAADAQRAFAQSVADRYAFDWPTHAYDPDTGVVRRVCED